jgi:hypothetical protein
MNAKGGETGDFCDLQVTNNNILPGVDGFTYWKGLFFPRNVIAGSTAFTLCSFCKAVR